MIWNDTYLFSTGVAGGRISDNVLGQLSMSVG